MGACSQQNAPSKVWGFCKETAFSGAFTPVYSYFSRFSEEQHSRGRLPANLVCRNCSSTAKKTEKNDNSRKPHTNLLSVGWRGLVPPFSLVTPQTPPSQSPNPTLTTSSPLQFIEITLSPLCPLGVGVWFPLVGLVFLGCVEDLRGLG